MRKPTTVLKAAAFLAFTLALASLAQAQATRTFVSGVGNDADPCSRTAPCRTFSGAFVKTATGGEISVLDPGGYGTLTITKAITVDGGTGSGWGSTLFSGVASGFTINITTNLASDSANIRIIDSDAFNNTTGIAGNVRSAGNNRFAANGSNGAPAPTDITIQ